MAPWQHILWQWCVTHHDFPRLLWHSLPDHWSVPVTGPSSARARPPPGRPPTPGSVAWNPWVSLRHRDRWKTWNAHGKHRSTKKCNIDHRWLYTFRESNMACRKVPSFHIFHAWFSQQTSSWCGDLPAQHSSQNHLPEPPWPAQCDGSASWGKAGDNLNCASRNIVEVFQDIMMTWCWRSGRMKHYISN